MIKGYSPLMAWLLDLFNPPLRQGLSFRQKISRTSIIVGTILVTCIILALVTASVFAVRYQIPQLTGYPESRAQAAAILLISICGNAICILILMKMRRFDRKHLPGNG